ncbi:MAG: flagellar basal body protein FliL [Spirochaetes bacterium]|nr:flagellar basal body protein FliL [Spirochaetota bacterium]
MADNDEMEGLESETGGESGTTKKKGGGLKAILPTLLKFVAIGLGALIFIVTITVVTFNIMNRGGAVQTAVFDPTSPYVGRRPEFAMFTQIGPITARTRDAMHISVTAEMVIAYDMGDMAALSELTNRQYELRDFVRRYFSNLYAMQLAPERETEIRREIREHLNTRILHTARVRDILFVRLDIMEMW